LIEHPDRKDGVFVSNWAIDIPQGLVLAPWGEYRWATGELIDQGLYPNAEEYIDKLGPKLEQALKTSREKRIQADAVEGGD
jgi:hypothetical protein